MTDVFKAGPSGGFVMTRTAQVAGVGNGADLGYNTQFAIGFAGAAQSITSYHFLAPGIWYDRNVNAATGAIGTDLTSHDYFFWRKPVQAFRFS